ncbi:uncharacterized protein LOC128960397 [Oppia nitens]|uniref:uncharacterized protein LOC128960397 n=1 Tax=Oppia nitens TaxID=1686743 RepID=UPI0023DA8395|nr:uncharacterized protein LOC128960397 [Oppia nitens]
MTRITADPTEILDRLKQYSCRVFSSDVKRQEKTELNKDLWKYLGEVVPNMCTQVLAILSGESNVVNVSSPAYVLGDLHGNLEDIYEDDQKMCHSSDPQISGANYVFLGDFVDRGKYSIEVTVYLFALKMTDKSKYVLIRGNHEVRSVNKEFTFFRECVHKFGRQLGRQIWDAINKCFESLPLVAVIDNTVFCCHGGIPQCKPLVKLEEINKWPKPMVDPYEECMAAHELLWNDPIESMTTFDATNTESTLRQKKILFVKNRSRSTGYYYTAEAVNRFLNNIHMSHMIRAHECIKHGFRWSSNKRVVTVFSSSNYCDKENTTSCAKVIGKEITQITLKDPKEPKDDSIRDTNIENTRTDISVNTNANTSSQSNNPNTSSANNTANTTP